MSKSESDFVELLKLLFSELQQYIIQHEGLGLVVTTRHWWTQIQPLAKRSDNFVDQEHCTKLEIGFRSLGMTHQTADGDSSSKPSELRRYALGWCQSGNKEVNLVSSKAQTLVWFSRTTSKINPWPESENILLPCTFAFTKISFSVSVQHKCIVLRAYVRNVADGEKLFLWLEVLVLMVCSLPPEGSSLNRGWPWWEGSTTIFLACFNVLAEYRSCRVSRSSCQ